MESDPLLLLETILLGETQTALDLIRQDKAKIRQTVPGSSNTILHLTARFGRKELASEILNMCPEMVAAENEKMETPLHEACREGRIDFVELFVGADRSVLYKLNRNNESVLYVACERGWLDVVKQLLNYSSLLMLEVDGVTTSLHVAAMAGHPDIVKALLNARPEFAQKKDLNGYTPLHLSCRKGHLEITKELLKLDRDLASSPDNEGRTPLHWAAIKGRINIIDKILSLKPQSAEKRTIHGETVLHLGVKNNQFRAVKHLAETLKSTELVNMSDNDGNTILHLATAGKLITMVKYLLELDVNVYAINQAGYTAVDIAKGYGTRNPSRIRCALEAKEVERRKEPEISLDTLSLSSSPIFNRSSLDSSLPERAHVSPPKGRSLRRQRNRGKHSKLQDEGLRNARKTIILVATLIATVTFAAGINPPGGYDQVTGKFIVGKKTSFKVFTVCNILALFMSLGVAILLESTTNIERESLKKLLAVIHKLMWLSMSLMEAAYIAALWTVMPHGRGMVWLLVVLVSVGGGCTLAIFGGLGIFSFRIRKSKEHKLTSKANRPSGGEGIRIRKSKKHKLTSKANPPSGGEGIPMGGEGVEIAKSMNSTTLCQTCPETFITSDSELDGSDGGDYYFY